MTYDQTVKVVKAINSRMNELMSIYYDQLTRGNEYDNSNMKLHRAAEFTEACDYILKGVDLLKNEVSDSKAKFEAVSKFCEKNSDETEEEDEDDEE